MSQLKPEQERALAYLRRKGTEAPVERLRAGLAEALARIESAFDAVPVDLRVRRPGPDRWCPQEILDHLIESHRPAVAQLARVLAGEDAPEAVPASLLSADPFARSWEEQITELRAVHREWLELLAAASDETSLAATAGLIMVIKVATSPDEPPEPVEWYERLDWKAFTQALRVHTLEHLAQLERTVAPPRLESG